MQGLVTVDNHDCSINASKLLSGMDSERWREVARERMGELDMFSFECEDREGLGIILSRDGKWLAKGTFYKEFSIPFTSVRDADAALDVSRNLPKESLIRCEKYSDTLSYLYKNMDCMAMGLVVWFLMWPFGYIFALSRFIQLSALQGLIGWFAPIPLMVLRFRFLSSVCDSTQPSPLEAIYGDLASESRKILSKCSRDLALIDSSAKLPDFS